MYGEVVPETEVAFAYGKMVGPFEKRVLVLRKIGDYLYENLALAEPVQHLVVLHPVLVLEDLLHPYGIEDKSGAIVQYYVKFL